MRKLRISFCVTSHPHRAQRFSIIETSAQHPLLGMTFFLFFLFFLFLFPRRPFPTTRQSNHPSSARTCPTRAARKFTEKSN